MPSLGSHQKRCNISFDDMLERIGCSMEAEFDTSLRLDGVAEDNKLLTCVPSDQIFVWTFKQFSTMPMILQACTPYGD
jgi:hypothetical protein